jgi:hypothetical protein
MAMLGGDWWTVQILEHHWKHALHTPNMDNNGDWHGAMSSLESFETGEETTWKRDGMGRRLHREEPKTSFVHGSCYQGF